MGEAVSDAHSPKNLVFSSETQNRTHPFYEAHLCRLLEEGCSRDPSAHFIIAEKGQTFLIDFLIDLGGPNHVNAGTHLDTHPMQPCRPPPNLFIDLLERTPFPFKNDGRILPMFLISLSENLRQIEAPRACLPTGRHSAGLPGNDLLFLYSAP